MKIFIITLLLISSSFAQEASSTTDATKPAQDKVISKEKLSETKEAEKPPGPCDMALELAQLVVDKRWSDVAKNMRFPWRRSWPFKPLTKEAFLQNPGLVFEPNMFNKSVSIRQNGDLCMINKGQMWTETKKAGGRIVKVNFETSLSKQARLEATKNELAYLLKSNLPATVLLSCDFSGSQFMVYREQKTGQYLLLVEKGGKVEKRLNAGQFRQDDAGVRHFRFQENTTTLTVGENMRNGAYYLALKTQSGQEKFYDCL